MAETKYYNFETHEGAKFTVYGGKRQTSYNDVKSFCKRVKSLGKQGKVIRKIRRYGGDYVVYMGEPLSDFSDPRNLLFLGECHTAGYQSFKTVPEWNQHRINYHGKLVVIPIY